MSLLWPRPVCRSRSLNAEWLACVASDGVAGLGLACVGLVCLAGIAFERGRDLAWSCMLTGCFVFLIGVAFCFYRFVFIVVLFFFIHLFICLFVVLRVHGWLRSSVLFIVI